MLCIEGPPSLQARPYSRFSVAPSQPLYSTQFCYTNIIVHPEEKVKLFFQKSEGTAMPQYSRLCGLGPGAGSPSPSGQSVTYGPCLSRSAPLQIRRGGRTASPRSWALCSGLSQNPPIWDSRARARAIPSLSAPAPRQGQTPGTPHTPPTAPCSKASPSGSHARPPLAPHRCRALARTPRPPPNHKNPVPLTLAHARCRLSSFVRLL